MRKHALTHLRKRRNKLFESRSSGNRNDISDLIMPIKEIDSNLILDEALLNGAKVQFPATSNEGSSLHVASNENRWFLIGASVTGNGHKNQNLPCQDAHKTEIWSNGWGVAIVSDGAGSAKMSHLASAFLVDEAAKQAFELVKSKNWMEDNLLPTEKVWDSEARKLLFGLQDSLKKYANDFGIMLKELHATLIINIFSPKGLLSVHIGDGRAGYLTKSGDMHASMEPFEGDQVGATVFITMDMENFKEIVKTKVISEPVSAFFMLSDGCERVCWETIQQIKETGKFIKPNKPFEPFFRHTIQALKDMHQSMKPELITENWYNYLESGHKGFIEENDDKTMLIGISIEK